MWKRIFRIWIPARVYFSATFGQYGVGAAIAIGLMLLRDSFIWSPSWIMLGVGGVVCTLISASTIALIDSVLPGGMDRRKLLFRLGTAKVPIFSRLLIGSYSR